MRKIDRIGETNVNRYGSRMTIIEYNSYSDIIVKFDDGYITKTKYDNFQEGIVRNLYDKAVYNVGYQGEGKYKFRKNNKETKTYKTWAGMLERCYDEKYKKKEPTYKNVTCCEEWLNYQNFAKWYDENYYEVDDEIMNLDKDILNKGNKIYSPETCVFVPERVNKLFTKNDANRGKYPIGVDFRKSHNKFRARCSVYVNNKKSSKDLGYYNTSDEAFYNGYKPFKEQYIKEVAEKYKSRIPNNLYNAMYNWKVEITD